MQNFIFIFLLCLIISVYVKLKFFQHFFLKPGLTKTFYFMKYSQFLLFCTVCFMLENLKKKIYDMGSAGNGGSVIPRSIGMVKGCLPPKFPVWARKTK